MMSSYRYVIFPRGRQPSADEVRRLNEFAGALANQFAWGVGRDDGRLAVAIEARAFDHVMASDAGFEALVTLWEGRGAERAEHFKFVKDATALKPTRAVVGAEVVTRRRPLSAEAVAAAKRAAAHEAIAHSLLGVQRTLERYAALERLGAVLPYVLMAAGILLTAGAGVYVHRQLAGAERESRQATIERLATDPPSSGEAEAPEE